MPGPKRGQRAATNKGKKKKVKQKAMKLGDWPEFDAMILKYMERNAGTIKPRVRGSRRC